MYTKYVKNSFAVCMVLKIVTIPVSLVSLDICEETQKGQSMMWVLGGCVEVRNDLVSRACFPSVGLQESVSRYSV